MNLKDFAEKKAEVRACPGRNIYRLLSTDRLGMSADMAPEECVRYEAATRFYYAYGLESYRLTACLPECGR